ncbi:STAS domain-containing protein [Bacillus thuringiensis]|uniref:SulP family inorganic anion transporter n=1 Tax=Bacillus thuringiensis TaxID=1428 RepID=UPI0010AD84F2|nr:SulP family inorganic anion transporter [Bacillus thuringiensis]TJZ99923.1 STAS domain-containing protein [Bacillus thuringiensis]
MKFSGRYVGYGIANLQKDMLAGLVVGIVAIPLAMAFAIACGVRPEYGIYTTIIAGILVSVFGGSKYQIAGPTGAFVPILLGVVMQFGYENLLIAGFMSGILLIIMGACKLGKFINFIPRPVTIGFTTGIAVIIFSGQIANFLGLHHLEKQETFFYNMKEIGTNISELNPYSIFTSVLCLGIVIAATKWLPRIPGALLGLIISSVIATIFFPDQIATIGTTYGDIPHQLPEFQIPSLTLDNIIMLLPAACIIAALGGIESLLSAMVADNMANSKHNSNKELVGQGIANIVVPLFGGIPATGAIARTATNIKNGATSPVAGIIHGIVVLLVLLFLSPLAFHIPLASMAPILMVVAWNMSEKHEFIHIFKTKTGDTLVLLSTFVLTVFSDLTTGVGVGLLLSFFLFVGKMSKSLRVRKVLPDPVDSYVNSEIVGTGKNCPQISLFTVEGPLFFGSIKELELSVETVLQSNTKILLLRMGEVSFMDTSAESTLEHIRKKMVAKQGILLISGIQHQPKEIFYQTGLYERIGKQHFFTRTGLALNFALQKLEVSECTGCKQFAFQECATLSNQPVETESEIKRSHVKINI